MFKKIILVLALICIIVLTAYGALSGTYTTNGYFYRPGYGSYGLEEYNAYNAAMQVADTQIEANKGTFGSYYLKTEIDTQGEVEAIWGVSLVNDGDLDLYYLKTEIDSQSEMETIWGVSLLNDITGESIGDLSDVDLTNLADNKILKYNSATSKFECEDDTGGGGGAFTDLTDTPAAYTGKEGKTLRVNSTPDAVEFVNYNNITTKTTTATLTVAEQGLILVSASGAYTITLPTAVGNTGLTYHFVKTDYNYNLITLDGNGTETLNYPCDAGTPQLTYARLNTGGAEITIVSDNANWQVIDEALGQAPSVCIESTADIFNIKTSAWAYIPLDDEIYDIGSNYDVSEWISGTADGTVTDHLQDDTASPFTAAMVGYRVKNTTDTTYAWITAFNDIGDVTLSADIFVNGEGYQIMNSKFVAPVAGTYFISASLCYENVVLDKRYMAALHKNGTNIRAKAEHASINEFIYPNVIVQEPLAKDDYIQLTGLQLSGVDTVDIDGGAATYIQIRLISKD